MEMFVEGRPVEDGYVVNGFYYLNSTPPQRMDQEEEAPHLFVDQQDAIDASKEMLEKMYEMRFLS